MRKRILMMLAIIGFIISLSFINVTASSNEVIIYFFNKSTCQHCAEEKELLAEITTKYENVKVISYTVDDADSAVKAENERLLTGIVQIFEQPYITPMTIIGGKCFAGYNGNVKKNIEYYVEKYQTTEYVDIMAKYLNGEEILDSDFDRTSMNVVNIPILGDVNVKEASLVLIAIVMGFVDGVNPCAMWVLIFLISMLIPTNDRKKIWILGGSFLIVSAVFYFIVMLLWGKILEEAIGFTFIQVIIGIIALGAGAYNIYKYIKAQVQKDVGCEVTSTKQKRKIMEKMREAINKDSLILAIIGIAGIAVLVNLVELACSAGLPVLFTEVLALNGISTAGRIGYTLIYILFFLVDDLIVFSIAAISLKLVGTSNKFTKYSHLVGGIIMIIIGILMIFFPSIIMFNF